MKNVVLNRPWKVSLLIVLMLELKQEVGARPRLTSAGNTGIRHQAAQIFPDSVCMPGVTVKVPAED